jgi:hypothetical protein
MTAGWSEGGHLDTKRMPLTVHDQVGMQSNPSCSRRRFCLRLLNGLGALLCSGAWPAIAASPYGRPAGRYAEAKLPAVLQPKRNPYLVPPHGQLRSFALTAGQRAVPGVVFATGTAAVRATAPGIVHFIGQRTLSGSGFGGTYIRIAHDIYDGLKKSFYPRVTLYRPQAYRSTIYGLETVVVEHWQSVQREQIIGYGLPDGALGGPKVKLVLEERDNPVNPDDYGPRHSFMRYAANGGTWETDLQEMHRRLDRQAQVIEQLNAFYADRLQDDIYKKIHSMIDTEKFTGYPVLWSTVERFRYLLYRFREEPQRFPGLSSKALDLLTRTFYENQPIVLTLPLTPQK